MRVVTSTSFVKGVSAFGCVMSFILATLLQPATAQNAPKYEFRGTWIATVLNLDWPTQRTDPAAQQADLISRLDALQAAGINAVFFQVRPESDALYASELEPWSYWLTGSQGTGPVPFYDPLAFVIEEAHRRGMELHAWINPYRAVRGSGYPNAEDHVSVLHPEWMLTFGNLMILDPGLQEVRDYIVTVIMDVARRYDIDGIHFDDFFYPYPPNEISIQDAETFQEFPRGFSDIQDWRRDNVNLMIAQVSDSLESVVPHVKFGVSPFGIWRNGVPSGITGLDAYNVIYGDALAWLGDQTVDYLAPQLYWPFGGNQDYAKLGNWWAAQAFGRHMYMGHALYRADAATFAGTLYDETEVPNQVRFNRGNIAIQGNVFFRSSNLTNLSSKGFADSLSTDLFKYPALTPQMEWKDQTAPGAPRSLAFARTDVDGVVLTWSGPGENQGAAARRYVVYRVRSAESPDPEEAVQDVAHVLAITGDTMITDNPGIAEDPYHYFITAASSNSIESEVSNIVVVEGRTVTVERSEVPSVALFQNFPNPFRTRTEIRFSLEHSQSVSLSVYDITGRRVATLVHSRFYKAGEHVLYFEGNDEAGVPLASGTYYYRLATENWSSTRGMVLLR